VSNIAPLAQNLTLNGLVVPGKYLLQPLVKIWGGKVRNLDGSEAPQEFDKNNQKLNYITKYFLIPGNYTADSIVTYELPEDLEEGYYQINAVVSVVTDYPKLVALNGLTQIDQADLNDATIKGKYEALSFQVTNNSLVGIQNSLTTLSEISGSSTDKVIQVSLACS
jgi:hypothetical protein